MGYVILITVKKESRSETVEYIIKEEKDIKITVRDVQLELLEMMKVIDELCLKNQLPYMLCGGSALGAIRHQGFIPWDDDMDISIKREDYQRFLKILEEQLPKDYVFHCFERDNHYNITYPSIKIRKKNTFVREKNKYLINQCKDCDGIFIDVFVLNHMSKYKFLDFLARIPNILLAIPILMLENLKINPILLKKIFYQNALWYGNMCKKSPYIGEELTWIYKNPMNPYRYLKDEMFPTSEQIFEGIKFCLPKNPEHYLIQCFGKNYMTPPPMLKQYAKHVDDINLTSNKSDKIEQYNLIDNLRVVTHYGILFVIGFIILSLVFWGDYSFIFIGLAMSLIGIIEIIYYNLIKDKS